MSIEEMEKSKEILSTIETQLYQNQTIERNSDLIDILIQLICFIGDSINQHKDHIEKIAKLEREAKILRGWNETISGLLEYHKNFIRDFRDDIARLEKEIARLSKKNDEEFLKGEEYHYEPNE